MAERLRELFTTQAGLLALACCVVLPTLIVLGVPNPINQATSVDPGLYSALIFDYGELTDRFGATYYATRVAYLFPAKFFYTLFGLETGYILWRIVLLCALSSSVYFLLRNWFNPVIASLFAASAAFGPWVLRALMWDYTDGGSIVYLVAALALAVDYRGSAWRAVAAGAVFALAVSVSTINLAFAGAFLGSWVYLLRLDWAQAARRVLLIASGFVAAYALMSIAVYINYPVMGPFFESINIRFSMQMLRGTAETWHVPLDAIFQSGRYYAALPFVTLLILAVSLFGAPRAERGSEIWRFQVAALAYLVLVCAGLAVLHFVVRSATLGVPWGIIYAFPATLLGWAAILGPSLARIGARSQLVLIGFLVAAALAFFLAARFWLYWSTSIFDRYDLLLVGCIVALAAAAAIRQVRPLALGGLFLIAIHSPYRSEDGFFAVMHDASRRAVEEDVMEGGRALLQMADESAPSADGPLVIWYPPSAPFEYYGLTSFLFWGYSVIEVGGGNLPELSEENEDDIRNSGYLFILSPTSEEIQQGLGTLAEREISYQIVRQGVWRGTNGWGYDFMLLSLR